MKRATLIGSVTACLCLGFAVPVLAAQPAATPPAPSTAPTSTASTSTEQAPPASAAMRQASASATGVSATKPAGTCLGDLAAFDGQMEKSGYWLGTGGYGYGSPVYAWHGGPPSKNYREAPAARYRNVRPGYEVRTLVASANILARHGQQQACEDVLGATRSAFKLYVADLLSGRVPRVNSSLWRKQQITAARPVATENATFPYNELIGTEVRNPGDKALGSIDDLVIDPHTGKIAYVIIGRGGLFRIGEAYVPVPWDDFKSTPSLNLLVLDTTKAAMSAAPHANEDQFKPAGQFNQESQKVDAYWQVHLSNKSGPASKSNG